MVILLILIIFSLDNIVKFGEKIDVVHSWD